MFLYYCLSGTLVFWHGCNPLRTVHVNAGYPVATHRWYDMAELFLHPEKLIYRLPIADVTCGRSWLYLHEALWVIFNIFHGLMTNEGLTLKQLVRSTCLSVTLTPSDVTPQLFSQIIHFIPYLTVSTHKPSTIHFTSSITQPYAWSTALKDTTRQYCFDFWVTLLYCIHHSCFRNRFWLSSGLLKR